MEFGESGFLFFIFSCCHDISWIWSSFTHGQAVTNSCHGAAVTFVYAFWNLEYGTKRAIVRPTILSSSIHNGLPFCNGALECS